jgi:two-component system chemotaxis response regulator CheY
MGPSVRILVVDDMPAVRLIIRNMLEEAGFTQVIEAEDGEAAWKLIRNSVSAPPEHQIHVVICDWNMPGMTGIDLLRAVRGSAHTRELPFLMITGEGNPALHEEAAAAGVTDFVVKPFSSAQLSEQVSRLLGR